MKKAACFAPFRAARRKRWPVWHRSGLRGEKGGLFGTVPGCAAKKAGCFSQFLGARRKRRAVWHRSGLRGEKGGPFFTVPSCAVKKAGCFSQFLGARSKRRAVFHSSCLRGQKGGPFFTVLGCAGGEKRIMRRARALFYTPKRNGRPIHRRMPCGGAAFAIHS